MLGNVQVLLEDDHSDIAVRRFGAREIASERQEVESAAPPRTTGQPGGETRRGKEHAGKAEGPEGM